MSVVAAAAPLAMVALGAAAAHAALRAVGSGVVVPVLWLLLAEQSPELDEVVESERAASSAAVQASRLVGRAAASIVVVPIVEELGFVP